MAETCVLQHPQAHCQVFIAVDGHAQLVILNSQNSVSSALAGGRAFAGWEPGSNAHFLGSRGRTGGWENYVPCLSPMSLVHCFALLVSAQD